MPDAVGKLDTSSPGNQLPIMLHAARRPIRPTRVAGFGTRKALGRSVTEVATELAVLAPTPRPPLVIVPADAELLLRGAGVALESGSACVGGSDG